MAKTKAPPRAVRKLTRVRGTVITTTPRGDNSQNRPAESKKKAAPKGVVKKKVATKENTAKKDALKKPAAQKKPAAPRNLAKKTADETDVAKKKMAKKQSESFAALGARTAQIVALLKHYYPNAHCALHHESPFQLLIATILSAQCTDERVNQVTPPLFTKYPKPQAFAAAPLADLEEAIRPTGFFRNKARNIKACCQALVDRYQGELPQTMEELTALAGVGRKTANVVLGNAFAIPGMVVDTHVTRLANRLGLAAGENAESLERDLERVVAREDWIVFSHLLIQHGRTICKARKPQCERCFLSALCPAADIVGRFAGPAPSRGRRRTHN